MLTGSPGAKKPLMARQTRAKPPPSRSNNRPNPGQPSGNVENRRCRKHPVSIVHFAARFDIPGKGFFAPLFQGYGETINR
jgi:hypothetical protein